jgi:hypothetical protein
MLHVFYAYGVPGCSVHYISLLGGMGHQSTTPTYGSGLAVLNWGNWSRIASDLTHLALLILCGSAHACLKGL